MNAQADTHSLIALAAAVREQANALILASLAERGITDILPAHGAVLHVLFQQGPLHMSVLAERIGRKKNTVTGLINTLEERGYCRRAPDPGDARAHVIALTPKGEEMRAIQESVSENLLHKAWGAMPEQEKQACIRGLQAVLRNLRE